MRTHLHNDPVGMSRHQVGQVMFTMGLTDRPLTQKEVWTIERRALGKLRKALKHDIASMKGDR